MSNETKHTPRGLPCALQIIIPVRDKAKAKILVDSLIAWELHLRGDQAGTAGNPLAGLIDSISTGRRRLQELAGLVATPE